MAIPENVLNEIENSFTIFDLQPPRSAGKPTDECRFLVRGEIFFCEVFLFCNPGGLHVPDPGDDYGPTRLSNEELLWFYDSCQDTKKELKLTAVLDRPAVAHVVLRAAGQALHYLAGSPQGRNIIQYLSAVNQPVSAELLN